MLASRRQQMMPQARLRKASWMPSRISQRTRSRRNQGSPEPGQPGTRAARNQGSPEPGQPGTRAARNQGSPEPGQPGTRAARNQGSPEPGQPGTRAARNQGSPEPGGRQLGEPRRQHPFVGGQERPQLHAQGDRLHSPGQQLHHHADLLRLRRQERRMDRPGAQRLQRGLPAVRFPQLVGQRGWRHVRPGLRGHLQLPGRRAHHDRLVRRGQGSARIPQRGSSFTVTWERSS